MRLAPVVATLVTACVAIAVTALVGWPAGMAAGVVAAVVTGRLVVARWDGALGDLASQVRRWRQDRTPLPVERMDDPVLGDLAAALEATGRDFDRQLALRDEAMPWRREMVDALPTPAVLFGADGYLVAANRPARDLLGIASDGEPTTMLSALGSAQLAAGVRAAAGGGPVELDAEVSGRFVRAVATTIGRQQLVMVTDRTRERKVENLRRNFVVNASHELKTPVSSIQALAEALLVMVDRDPARLPSLLGRLEEEATRLAQVVHDLLDLRRLEEQVAVRPERVQVDQLVRRVVAQLADAAAGRDITIAMDVPDGVVVDADAEDLQVVVRNLVNNAIQYGRPGGHVWVDVRSAGDEVVLEVRDDGLGIPKADLSRVFERFYRVDVARSRETGGTGLGLSLVRNAVRRAGGSVAVDSLLGSGTTFTVRLPASTARPASPDQSPEPVPDPAPGPSPEPVPDPVVDVSSARPDHEAADAQDGAVDGTR